MFIVKQVCVEVAWQRGGETVDVGWIYYQAPPDTPFDAVDGAINSVIPDAMRPAEGSPPSAEQLHQQLGEQTGKTVQATAPARTVRPAPTPPGRTRRPTA